MGAGYDKLKGRIKAAVGDATGDRGLRREGKLDQAAGDLKTKTNQAVDRVRATLRSRDRRAPQR